jgi:hypothetical protein
MVKLDLGCGKNKKEGFIGVDQYAMENVDVVLDIGNATWPWKDGEVEEIHASHFLEHLTQEQRVHFMNEAYRVMKDGAKATIITPHWASNRAYGDITHCWPAVSEMFFYYLKQEWRDTQAPHTDIKWNPKGFSCDFDATWGYSFGGELQTRHAEYVQFALQNYKDAAQDLHATLTKPLLKENND